MTERKVPLTAYTGDELRAMSPAKRADIDMCTCGAPRSLHSGLSGHGPSNIEASSCDRFTWSHWAPKPTA